MRKNVARYINHACKPNAESDVRPRKRKVYIRAIKNIEPGEEINYDYGTDYFKAYLKPIGCKCEACEKKRKKKRAEARVERLRLKAKAARKAEKEALKAQEKEKLKEKLKLELKERLKLEQKQRFNGKTAHVNSSGKLINGNGTHANGGLPNGRGRSKSTAARPAAAKPRVSTKLRAGATATGQKQQALA